MGPTSVYRAGAEKPLQNADFAMKQTNICRRRRHKYKQVPGVQTK